MKRLGLLACVMLAALAAGVVVAAPRKAATTRRAVAAKSAAVVNDSDRVLVRIGSEVITPRMLATRLQELPEQYRPQYSTPEGKRQLLDRLIEEKAWMRDAEANGVTRRPDVVLQLEAQRRDLILRTWVQEVMAKNPAPSDSEATAYYQAHLDEWRTPGTVTMKHIQLKTEADARRVLGLARTKGQDWDRLAKTWSQDTLTRNAGGALGTTTREGGFASLGAQPALAESAMALGTGAIGGPYRTDKGWHVIQVDNVREESVRDFEQVRSFIVRQLQQERTQRFYQEQVEAVKQRYKVVSDSSAVDRWLSARKSARELFQEAQSIADAPSRIDAYRRIVEEYPDADVTPQALFMVGFIHSEELRDFDAAERVFRELLQKYPSSELATSAQWMVDHMRTETVPDFLHSDSTATGEKKPATKGTGGKP
jgi:peptidyl-prolyl cis-trans isomerase C